MHLASSLFKNTYSFSAFKLTVRKSEHEGDWEFGEASSGVWISISNPGNYFLFLITFCKKGLKRGKPCGKSLRSIPQTDLVWSKKQTKCMVLMLEGVKLSSHLTPINITQWKNRWMWLLDVPQVAAIGTNHWQGIVIVQLCSANVIIGAPEMS